MTGGGKSVFLRQALTFPCLDHPPKRLKLVLLDLKGGVGLAHFSYLPLSMFPVADGVTSAAETLSRVREELDRRLSSVRRSVGEEGSAAHDPWPRFVVLVDEVAKLTVRDLGDDRAARAAQQAATGRLCEIARLGRSVDIHLVCCTQRPDAEAVPGQLKANLDGTVAFSGHRPGQSLRLRVGVAVGVNPAQVVTRGHPDVGISRSNQWCRGAGSNRRHRVFQTRALPTELPRPEAS